MQVALRLYERASNARINKEKLVLMPVGPFTEQDWLFPRLAANSFVTHLGVPLNSAGLAPASAIWPGILTKMESATSMICKRFLTLRARSFCFSLLVASRGRHIACFIPPDSVTLSAIKQMYHRCIWRDKKRGNVAWRYCNRDIDEDCLGV